MFSGIVKSVGIVQGVLENDESFVLKIASPLLADAIIGESVCVSGVCLTVVSRQDDVCSFDLATETRRCSILGNLKVGASVNLERSMRSNDAIHGHFVQGHVDAVAKVIRRDEKHNTVRFEFELPQEIADLVVPKGSVSIDGVSLTVGEVSENSFSVYIIPHTLDETVFAFLQIGDDVNIEADCIARYVKNIVEHYLGKSQHAK